MNKRKVWIKFHSGSVPYLDGPVFINQKIRWFQIPVNYCWYAGMQAIHAPCLLCKEEFEIRLKGVKYKFKRTKGW
jgi:hypothetical protein